MWYIALDIIRFARQLGMVMEVALGSRANICEVMEMLDVLESTRFQSLPGAWSDRTSRSIQYYPGPTGRWADYVLNDPWIRHKIDDNIVW